MPGYVYIIGDRESQKIGHTFGNPKGRLKAIQTCSPKKLRIILAFPCDKPDEEEINLHKRYIDKRLIGEWFSLSEGDLNDLLSEHGNNGFNLEYEGDTYREECIGVAQKMFQLRKIIAHTCAVCGIEFQALKTAKFCSNRCRQAAKYQRVRAAKGEKK